MPHIRLMFIINTNVHSNGNKNTSYTQRRMNGKLECYYLT